MKRSASQHCLNVMAKETVLALAASVVMLGGNSAIASSSGLNLIDPKNACSFLQSKGLKSQGWGELGSGGYGCPSERKEFGSDSESFERNDITYYVSSTNGQLTELKLFVNINNPKDQSSAKRELLAATTELLSKLGIKETPANLVKGINSATNAKASVNGINFTLTNMSWGNGRGQFSMKLVAE